MIFGRRNELAEGLAKSRDHVSDEILNREGQKAERQIRDAMRAGRKTKALNKKKNKRRRRK